MILFLKIYKIKYIYLFVCTDLKTYIYIYIYISWLKVDKIYGISVLLPLLDISCKELIK